MAHKAGKQQESRQGDAMSVQTVFAGGVNPWAMYFKPPKIPRYINRREVPKWTREPQDLTISNDPIQGYASRRPVNLIRFAGGKKMNKYGHIFDKMEVGQCVIADKVSPQAIGDCMKRWIVRNHRFDLWVRMTNNYNGTGIGRVWLVKA
jgi:hypothetical protein